MSLFIKVGFADFTKTVLFANPVLKNGNFTQSNPYQQKKRYDHLSLFNVRSFSDAKKKITCRCGAQLPSEEKIVKAFKSRDLLHLKNIKCPNFESFKYQPPEDCELIDLITEISGPLLSTFEDVLTKGKNRTVMLEAVHEIPKGDLGDLTGDYGKQLVKFLSDCLEKNLINEIGSVFDVGGQNDATISAIRHILKKPSLPCLIVDKNSITPALSKQKPHLYYAVDDAFSFFESIDYQDKIKVIINKKPCVVIFNNLLNVLKAEDGWKTLEICWSKLRSDDYLIISGLVPEQLEKTGLTKQHEVDGLIEFHDKNGFYKSALSGSFFNYVVQRLLSSNVLFEETFKFAIEPRPGSIMEVKGRRLLTLKKG